MRIYIILLAFILMNIFFEISFSTIKILKFRINTRKMSFFLCFFFILMIGLMRSQYLGVDVSNYRRYFLNFYPSKNITFFMFNFKYDIGYVLLNKFIRLFTGSFRIFENIVFLISFGIFSYVIYKRSKYPALSFLVYIGFGFIGTNLCILRQSIACAICFLSFDYLKRNKIYIYFFLILLATTFHKTAIFFILSYIIVQSKDMKISLVKKNILIILSILSSVYVISFLYKFYSNDYSEISISGRGYKLLIFYILISLILRIIMGNRNFKDELKDYDCSFSSIYFQIVALSFSLFTRVTSYYELMYTLSVPNISNKSEFNKFYVFVFSVLFSILFIFELINDGCQIVPYIPFFA